MTLWEPFHSDEAEKGDYQNPSGENQTPVQRSYGFGFTLAGGFRRAFTALSAYFWASRMGSPGFIAGTGSAGFGKLPTTFS